MAPLHTSPTYIITPTPSFQHGNATISSVSRKPTAATNPLDPDATLNHDAAQAIIFGILATVLAFAALVVACLQLRKMYAHEIQRQVELELPQYPHYSANATSHTIRIAEERAAIQTTNEPTATNRDNIGTLSASSTLQPSYGDDNSQYKAQSGSVGIEASTSDIGLLET